MISRLCHSSMKAAVDDMQTMGKAVSQTVLRAVAANPYSASLELHVQIDKNLKNSVEWKKQAAKG